MAEVPRLMRGRSRRAAAPAASPRADVARIQRLESHGLVWLHIESATEVETRALADEFGFHPLDLEDVLSRSRQRAKIDAYDEYLFLVLHFPRYHKTSGRLQAVELNVFVADGLLITIPEEPLKPVSQLWTACIGSEQRRAELMSKGSGYLLYAMVDGMYDYCFPILDKIGVKLDSLEDAIFEGQREQVVRDISGVTHEIINFRKIVKPQRGTLRLLERSTKRYASEDLELYFDDVVDKSERIWDGLENYKEVAEALEATNTSVVTHRLNHLIRNLTVLSAVMLPLTLVTGFYGQNIDSLPLANHGVWSVVWTLALMVAVAAGLLAWFRQKRWI
jgi:magnesium transporter